MSSMSIRVILLALFFAVGLLPQGWNKFDTTLHASLLYGLGALLMALLFLSWKDICAQYQDSWKKWSTSIVVKVSTILLSVLLVLAYVFSPIQNFGWSEVMVMIVGMGLFTIVQTFSEKERRDLLHIVLSLAVVSAVVGLGQYLFRTENRIAGPMYESLYKANYWPNAFALMLLMCWPICASMGERIAPVPASHSRILNIPFLKALAAGVMIAALILTFSRAAFLVLLCQMVVGAWFLRKDLAALATFKKLSPETKKTWLTILVTILIALVLTITLQTLRAYTSAGGSNSFLKKAQFSGTEQQTSFLERWQFMKGALQLIPLHPLLGNGPFSFRFVYPQIQPDFLAVSDHPHNWYLKIALEEGIPALIVFLVLIGAVFFARRDLLKEHSIGTSAMLLLGLMGPLIHNLADYNMNFLTNQMLFWIFLGFFNAKNTKDTNTSLNQNTLLVWPSIVAIGITITSVALLFEGVNSLSHHYDQMNFVRNYWYGEARYAVTQADTSKGIALMEQHLSLNPYDAFAWNYLGQIEEYVNPNEALKSYANAIKNDPANFFNFYVDYVKLAQKMKKTNTDAYKIYAQKALDFLQTYPEKVTANLHFTAQTGNVTSAIELAKLLGDLKLSLKIQRAIRAQKRA